MRTQLSAALLLLLLAAVAYPGESQVTARQGQPTEPEIVRFDSPMVLEIPLSDMRRLPPDAQRQLPSVRKYRCDNDVSLTQMYVTKKYSGRKRERQLTLVINGAISVADSYDRLVDIGLRLIKEGRLLANTTVRGISAEEERNTPYKVVLPVTESALEEAFATGSLPVLELTLTVHDNS